jgi:AcrR family transcriptional regulator
MPIEDRRSRERAARRQLIITTARRVAEAEGWDAVTTRRLSTEIEYSQPVLYTHFANMDELARAVAIDGFSQLGGTLRAARTDAATPAEALRQLAHAYVDFARQNPALYDVMFTRATTLHFAADDTPPELETAFAELRSVAGDHHDDADTFAEVLWSALHGLVTLGRGHRLRLSHDGERLELLLGQLSAQPTH